MCGTAVVKIGEETDMFREDLHAALLASMQSHQMFSGAKMFPTKVAFPYIGLLSFSNC
jgi:hypothetical protein